MWSTVTLGLIIAVIGISEGVDWRTMLAAVSAFVAVLALYASLRQKRADHLASLLREYYSDDMAKALRELDGYWEETKRHISSTGTLGAYVLAGRGMTLHAQVAHDVPHNEARRRVSALFVLAYGLEQAGVVDLAAFVRGVGPGGVALYLGVVAELDRALAARRPELCGDEAAPARIEKVYGKAFRGGRAKRAAACLRCYRPVDWQRALDELRKEAGEKGTGEKSDSRS
jgi:hypothetical protein